MSFYLTVDVEDWFQVENLRPLFPHSIWNKQEYRIENNVDKILELFSNYNSSATFFILGCIADKYPNIVKKIERCGHEIASHGDTHVMLDQLNSLQIEKELSDSKAKLESIIGKNVIGFRAPVFSITNGTFDTLKLLGYEYDSSLFPFKAHDRYGEINLNKLKKISETKYQHENGIMELSLPLNKLSSFSIPWAGGGYFRLIPYSLFKKGVDRILDKNGDFIFYFHPWEIDENQPRVTGISKFNRFRHYYGLSNTLRKLDKLLKTYNSNSLNDLI